MNLNINYLLIQCRFVLLYSSINNVKRLILTFQSSARKSAILSAAKKAKLKSNPSRVRFAESVDINGSLGQVNFVF